MRGKGEGGDEMGEETTSERKISSTKNNELPELLALALPSQCMTFVC